MLKISKLTDYALIILTYMSEEKVLSATSISEQTKIPLATTNKVLKQLLFSKICSSRSGKMGGFLLNYSKNNISLLHVVQAMEGKIPTITQCGNNQTCCQLKPFCKISDKMNLIDKEIHAILSKRFISDLV